MPRKIERIAGHAAQRGAAPARRPEKNLAGGRPQIVGGLEPGAARFVRLTLTKVLHQGSGSGGVVGVQLDQTLGDQFAQLNVGRLGQFGEKLGLAGDQQGGAGDIEGQRKAA